MALKSVLRQTMKTSVLARKFCNKYGGYMTESKLLEAFLSEFEAHNFWNQQMLRTERQRITASIRKWAVVSLAILILQSMILSILLSHKMRSTVLGLGTFQN